MEHFYILNLKVFLDFGGLLKTVLNKMVVFGQYLVVID